MEVVDQPRSINNSPHRAINHIMSSSITFLNPDGSICDAIYAQSSDPIVFTEQIPPSVKKVLRRLILDHRCWAALRRGELNDLFTILPALRELILAVVDWGELDTYIGTMQLTKLSPDRVVYHGEDVHVAPLDKNEFDSWAEYQDELLAMGGEVLTPASLARELQEVLSLGTLETAVGSFGQPVDVGGKKPKITVWGCRRVEEER